MPKLIKKLFTSLLGAVLFVNLIPNPVAMAQITDCDAVVSPNQVNPGSTTNFSITVTNGSAERIRHLKFTRPSANFTLGSIVASGWTVTSADSNSIAVNGSTINTGVSRTFTLTDVIAANVNAPSANWTVEVSDDGSGSNPYTCTGILGTQIGSPDVTPPTISGVTVSSLTATTATISWTTDEMSDSVVHFGLTASYGSSVSSSNLVTNHVLNLTGLTANTGYHFQVESSDASNNTATSADNTFLTQSLSSTQSPATGSKSQFTGDTTIPKVSLSTNFATPFKEAPTIFGAAEDNIAVVGLEYSSDGGSNWLPVDKTTGLGSKKATYEFKPLGLPDGNYDIFVRALDSSDNQGISEKAVLVIDKLPPVIGPNTISFGSQIVATEVNTIRAVRGVDERITIGTIGGPTSLVIKAISKDKRETKVFSLTKSLDSNLWSGLLAFEKPGTYSLDATAIDGANNKTSRALNTVFVGPPAKVVSTDGAPLSKAKLTVNYFEEESASWFVWDAAAFGQKNPQLTNSQGEFDFFLPAGKYYLKAEAPGHYSKTSDIFVNKEPTPLGTTIELSKEIGLSLGNLSISLPQISFASFAIGGEDKLLENQVTNTETDELPRFRLQSTSKEVVDSLNLASKPSLLTFVSTWSPATEEQIGQLEKLSKQSQYNIFIITTLESIEKARAYKSIGRYNTTVLVDPSGELLGKFEVLTVPRHIFVKRNLMVDKVLTGVIGEKDLQEYLDKIN